MGKYIDIANKALRETGDRPASPIKPSALCYEKNELNEISPTDKLRQLAGDNWPEISADPKQLEAFTAAAHTVELIQRGIVPDHYTATTECRRCGVVPIFPGLPPKVLGCPWCFARVRGVAVPKP